MKATPASLSGTPIKFDKNLEKTNQGIIIIIVVNVVWGVQRGSSLLLFISCCNLGEGREREREQGEDVRRRIKHNRLNELEWLSC